MEETIKGYTFEDYSPNDGDNGYVNQQVKTISEGRYYTKTKICYGVIEEAYKNKKNALVRFECFCEYMGVCFRTIPSENLYIVWKFNEREEMIRFIDLKGQIIEGEMVFAFYDTVTDRFVLFSSSQTWETVDEFKEDYEGDELERYLKLIPEEFLNQKEQPNPIFED